MKRDGPASSTVVQARSRFPPCTNQHNTCVMDATVIWFVSCLCLLKKHVGLLVRQMARIPHNKISPPLMCTHRQQRRSDRAEFTGATPPLVEPDLGGQRRRAAERRPELQPADHRQPTCRPRNVT